MVAHFSRVHASRHVKDTVWNSCHLDIIRGKVNQEGISLVNLQLEPKFQKTDIHTRCEVQKLTKQLFWHKGNGTSQWTIKSLEAHYEGIQLGSRDMLYLFSCIKSFGWNSLLQRLYRGKMWSCIVWSHWRSIFQIFFQELKEDCSDVMK